MTEESNGRVVEFKPKAQERSGDFPATIKRRDYGRECPHRQVVVDEPGRQVECEKCEAVLDPIAVLAWISREWDAERWRIGEDKKLNRRINEWHEAGGRISIQPSGVVVRRGQKRWSSRCSGGATAQLLSALESAGYDLRLESRS